jgi:hypothetical protein
MHYITYKDKELPLIINYKAIMKLNSKYSISKLSEFSKIDYDDLNNLEELMFYALEQGHIEENKEFKFTREHMSDIFNELGFIFFTDIMAEDFPKFSTGQTDKKK